MPLSSPLSELKPHYDVVVVGSGYGGGVAALRMTTRAGAKDGEAASVCVLERGVEWAAGDFPSTPASALYELQTSTRRLRVGRSTGLFDLRLEDEMAVLVGRGLGGTSLINANVMLRPLGAVFETQAWPASVAWADELERYYARVEEMLHARACPDDPPPTKVARFFEAGANATPASPVGKRPRLAVSFESRVDAGTMVHHRRCVMCGDCVTGCNHAAKNTVDRNYLATARREGAEIFCGVIVRTIDKVVSDGRTTWHLHVQPNDRSWRTFGSRRTLLVTADTVFLAAGTLGSTEILKRSAHEHGLPLSPCLGQRFSGNGDVIAFSYDGLERMNAVGYGAAVPHNADVGPCITGVLDERDLGERRLSIVIEDAAIPGPLAPLIRVGAPIISRLTVLRNAVARDLDFRHLRAELVTLLRGVHHGAVARTQLFLVMARDGMDGHTGTIEYHARRDRISISWPGIADAPLFQAINRRLQQLTAAFKGRFVANPLWVNPFKKRLITVHPLGGCAMGEDATRGVVNHLGQVFDSADQLAKTATHDGLYVCDGAIVPTSLGTNPALTIAALAERIADLARTRPGNARRAGYALPRTCDVTVPGIRYAERLTGHISLPEGHSPLELTLYIESDDVETLLESKEHAARIIGSARTPQLSTTTWTISDSWLQVLVEDPRQVDTLLLIYDLCLTAPDGTRRFLFGYKTINHESSRKRLWKAITSFSFIVNDVRQSSLPFRHPGSSPAGVVTTPATPNIDVLNMVTPVGSAPVALPTAVGSGSVGNSVLDSLRLGLSIDITRERRFTQRVAWTARYVWFFTLAVLEARFRLIRRTRRQDAFNRPSPSDVPTPTDRVTDRKNGRLPRYELTRFEGRGGPPVLISPGYGMSTDCFLVGDPSFVRFLLDHGYDVWLLDYRASDHLEISLTQYNFDDLVPDFADALMEVHRRTSRKVRIMAHCVGSMVTSMMLLRQGECLQDVIHSVVLSQSFPFLVHPWTNRVKSALRLPQVLMFLLPNPVLNTDDDLRASWKSRLLDRVLRLYPTREHCSCSVCRRIIFVYGEVLRHENLDLKTHDMLFDLFDRSNLTMFAQVAKMILRQQIVDHHGRNEYLQPGNALKVTWPVTLLQGELNNFFRPEGARRTKAWFDKHAPGHRVRVLEVPGYSHLDLFIGRDAAADVFPDILTSLERTD